MPNKQGDKVIAIRNYKKIREGDEGKVTGVTQNGKVLVKWELRFGRMKMIIGVPQDILRTI